MFFLVVVATSLFPSIVELMKCDFLNVDDRSSPVVWNLFFHNILIFSIDRVHNRFTRVKYWFVSVVLRLPCRGGAPTNEDRFVVVVFITLPSSIAKGTKRLVSFLRLTLRGNRVFQRRKKASVAITRLEQHAVHTR
mmetsp:Transcript_905/g.5710  ORF Transcript_905/g.5710 Transcript_905/m.5710 type:complete len:136 (-) Transcript_905:1924-2331(-)